MAKRTAKTQPQPPSVAAQVRLDVRSDTPSYYVNYIGVSHTPYDFTLTVAKVPSPPTASQLECVTNGKPMPLEAMLQIIVPPLLIEGLINALTDQKQKYAETAAKQVKNNELQHQHLKPLSSV